MGMGWETWTVETVLLAVKFMEFIQSHSILDEFVSSHLLKDHSMEEVLKIIRTTEDEWAFNSTTIINEG